MRDASTSEPLSNGSLCHSDLGSNVGGSPTLFSQHDDLFIASHSLSGANLLRVLDRLRLGGTSFFTWFFPLFL